MNFYFVSWVLNEDSHNSQRFDSSMIHLPTIEYDNLHQTEHAIQQAFSLSRRPTLLWFKEI